MEVKGVPPINVLQQASRCNLFFDSCLDPILVENSHGRVRRPNTKSLPQVLGCRDKNFIRFIDACLHWDPELRLTPDEALCHEWIVEGLPAKVLLHHQRLLGLQILKKDLTDKIEFKEDKDDIEEIDMQGDHEALQYPHMYEEEEEEEEEECEITAGYEQFDEGKQGQNEVANIQSEEEEVNGENATSSRGQDVEANQFYQHQENQKKKKLYLDNEDRYDDESFQIGHFMKHQKKKIMMLKAGGGFQKGVSQVEYGGEEPSGFGKAQLFQKSANIKFATEQNDKVVCTIIIMAIRARKTLILEQSS